MANLEYLRESVAALDYERRNSVDNYLLGILSVIVTQAEWQEAVNTAIQLASGRRCPDEQYIGSIERVIAEHQRVQMKNPPTSERWQEASKEINRLARLIVEATR